MYATVYPLVEIPRVHCMYIGPQAAWILQWSLWVFHTIRSSIECLRECTHEDETIFEEARRNPPRQFVPATCPGRKQRKEDLKADLRGFAKLSKTHMFLPYRVTISKSKCLPRTVTVTESLKVHELAQFVSRNWCSPEGAHYHTYYNTVVYDYIPVLTGSDVYTY